MLPSCTYQNQGGVVIGIPSIDIDPFSDLLLTNFEVPLTASIAELPERLTQIQRVIILDGTLLDQLLLIVQADLQLIFAKNRPFGHHDIVGEGADRENVWEFIYIRPRGGVNLNVWRNCQSIDGTNKATVIDKSDHVLLATERGTLYRSLQISYARADVLMVCLALKCLPSKTPLSRKNRLGDSDGEESGCGLHK